MGYIGIGNGGGLFAQFICRWAGELNLEQEDRDGDVVICAIRRSSFQFFLFQAAIFLRSGIVFPRQFRSIIFLK